jgi:hypothetical protein
MQHVWITSNGIATTNSRESRPFKNDSKIKVKYMGTTNKKGWPKKLNTGRILYAPKKLVQSQKTDTKI